MSARMHLRTTTRLPLLVLCLLAAFSARAEDASAPTAKKSDAAEVPFDVHGRLTTRYIYRTTGESSPSDRQTDQDLVEDGTITARRGDLRFEASGRLHEDIDGQARINVFRDIYDTYDSKVTGYLYTAYAEARDLGALDRAVAGRQYYGEGVDVRFDGALVESPEIAEAVKLTLYGGVPANLHESSPAGDWLVGGAAELTALPRTTVRLDYVHLSDRVRFTNARLIGDFTDVRDDDFFLLAVTHRPLEAVRLRGEASTFEGRSSRFSFEGLFMPPDGGIL